MTIPESHFPSEPREFRSADADGEWSERHDSQPPQYPATPKTRAHALLPLLGPTADFRSQVLMPELDEPLVNDAEPGWPHSHVIHIGDQVMSRLLAMGAVIA